MITEGLYARLISDPGVVALLGSTRTSLDSGLFPVIAPKEVLMPYIVYEQIGNNNDNMSAEGLNRTQEARFRYHCYGSTYKSAFKLAQAVKKSLAAFSGTLTDADATPVQDIIPNFEADGPIEFAMKNTIYNRTIDFTVIYVDTTN